MAFHLGSLGFLSPFEFHDYRERVDNVLRGLLHEQLLIELFRLHRMHEMQSILTDVCGVSLSVCHAAHLGFAVQKWPNKSRCCLE